MFSWELLVPFILCYIYALKKSLLISSCIPIAVYLFSGYLYHFFTLTIVRFYEDSIVIIHPSRLIIRKKNVHIKEIRIVEIGASPPNVSVYCRNEKHPYLFSSSLSKKKRKRVTEYFEQKGIVVAKRKSLASQP